jgi:hypothetical protein
MKWGGWRKLHGVQLNKCRPLFSKNYHDHEFKDDEIGKAAGTAETRKAYNILIGKPAGNLTGRSRCRWEDNTSIDLTETDSSASALCPLADSSTRDNERLSFSRQRR